MSVGNEVPDCSGTVYLLHFTRPYKHARHYIGYSSDLPNRLNAHSAGQGARLIAVIKAAGIDYEVARTWSGDRKLERKLKNTKHSARYCPICQREKRQNEQANDNTASASCNDC